MASVFSQSFCFTLARHAVTEWTAAGKPGRPE